jgi:K+-sensing histidine kinase KdpD
MEKSYLSSKSILEMLQAMGLVIALTVLMLLVGRDTLGEAVIALLYLIPIAWSANRWGQLAGTGAALTAALLFDYFFIPPFYTFAISRLEGWLVLAIFMTVSIVVVGRIQVSLTAAHEAVMMYDLSVALCGLRIQDAIAHTVAKHLQRVFQASAVKVIYRPGKNSADISVSEPKEFETAGRPDRQLPLLNTWGFVGEVQIWGNQDMRLPVNEGHLLNDFSSQISRAFERARLAEQEVK